MDLSKLEERILALELRIRELALRPRADEGTTHGCTHGCTGACPDPTGNCTYGCTDGCTNGCTSGCGRDDGEVLPVEHSLALFERFAREDR